MRKIKTAGLVLAMYAIALVMELIMVTGSADYEGGMSLLVILITLGIVGPKVGYRWFDCFFAAIPFYGVFFIFCFNLSMYPSTLAEGILPTST